MEKCFSAILRLCSFSFCIWFYVFAPGSHCFAIDIVNRSAICTVHLRSIWIAPLRFSTCRSWAGSRVTAAKLDPKKSKFHLPNWMFKCVFFTFFTLFFHVFSKCIFKTHFFHIFSKRIFKTHFFRMFSHFSHFCETMWKHARKCVLKMRLEKMWKTCVLKAVEKFLFLSSIFPCFFQIYVFQVFFEIQYYIIE